MPREIPGRDPYFNYNLYKSYNNYKAYNLGIFTDCCKSEINSRFHSDLYTKLKDRKTLPFWSIILLVTHDNIKQSPSVKSI